MEEYLNVTPGSATIMGLIFDPENRVQLVIDEELLKEEWFGCHPCINTSSLKLRTEECSVNICRRYITSILP